MNRFLRIGLVLLVVQLLAFSESAKAQTYCHPSFSSGCSTDSLTGLIIENVFSGTPRCNGVGFDSSGLTTPIKLYRGRTYKITWTSSAASRLGLYFDYNGDGDFADGGEYVAGDNNGTNASTFTSTITIPLTSKLFTTRLRIMTAIGSTSMDAGGSCASYSVGGGADYAIAISAYPHDIDVLQILEPAQNGCQNTSNPVVVVLRNLGSNSETNIPLTFTMGTTTINSTYTKTLAADAQDTFTMSSSVNTSSGGPFSFSLYSNLSTESDRSNDTFKASGVITYKQPNALTTSSASRCGYGTVTLKAASSTKGTKTYWFKSSKSDSVFTTGDSIVVATPGKSVTYYAEGMGTVQKSLTTKWYTVKANFGFFFDVVAKAKTIYIDSFYTQLYPAGYTDSVYVYYKKGSYKGSETNSSAWTLAGKVETYSKGWGDSTLVKVGGITVQAGETYGIYMQVKSGPDEFYYDVLPGYPDQNADLQIVSGSTIAALFSGSVTTSREWPGKLFYHTKICSTPRVALTAGYTPTVSKSKIIQSTPYKGYFSNGDFLNPDMVCTHDTVSYEITPPLGLKNSDFPTKWSIKSMTFATAKGYSTSDTLLKLPNPITNTNGKLIFFPSSKVEDSTLILKVTLSASGGYCDSSFTRYIQVGGIPKPKFGANKSCLGTPTSFFDSSTTTGTVGYDYDFGDGSAHSFSKFPSHTYANPGNYTVKLLITNSSGCFASTTRTITVYTPPTPKMYVSTACYNTYTTFIDSTKLDPGVTVKSATWDFGDGTKPDTTRFFTTHKYVKTGNITAKMTILTSTGCTVTATKTFTIQTKPVPGFTFTNACPGSNIIFTNSSTGATTYKWSFGDGQFSTLAAPKHSYISQGTYNVKLYAYSSVGCVDSLTKAVITYASPKIKFRASTACVGSSILFLDSSTVSGAGATIVSRSWDFGDGQKGTSTVPTINHSYAAAGTYYAWLKATTNQGCTDSASITVTVYDKPVADFTFIPDCPTKPVVFTDKSVSNGGALTYSWDFGDAQTSALANPSHQYGAPGTFTVTLKITNANGCTDQVQKSVTVVPVNPPVFSGTITQSTSTKKKIHFVLDNAANYGKIEWHFGDASTDSIGQNSPIDHIFNTGKSYHVRLLTETTAGCASEHDTTIDFTVGIAPTKENNDRVQVFPNPFSETTIIAYHIDKRSLVKVSVYDAAGREVVNLQPAVHQNEGDYKVTFDPAKYNAEAGTYVVKLTVDYATYTSQVIFVK